MANYDIFDEQYYLSQYQFVKDAVDRGIIRSGREHFERFGQEAGLTRVSRYFDEETYLALNPDIAPFVRSANPNGFFASGLDHFIRFGYEEGRTRVSPEYDEDFYLRNNSDLQQFGKVPEVCIEIVSNRKGNELDSKKDDYARIGIAYYVVFDPLQQLQREDELNGKLLKVWALTAGQYVEMPEPFWLQTVGLGLTVWQGEFEEQASTWLRWCNRDKQVIPTGAEGRDAERQRAERLAERLRAMGINPDEI